MEFNEKDFVWMKPKEKNRLAINIPNENDFNINPALRAELPRKITVGYIADRMILAIRQADDGYSIPKSGTIRIPELISELTKHNMTFPARFTVEKDADRWIATLVPQQKPIADFRKMPKRKKKPDLEALAKEAESL